MSFGVKPNWKTTTLFVLAATLLVAALLLPGCGGDEAATVEDKTSEEVYPKIQEIIYPVLGYAGIVPAGKSSLWSWTSPWTTPPRHSRVAWRSGR